MTAGIMTQSLRGEEEIRQTSLQWGNKQGEGKYEFFALIPQLVFQPFQVI
jgi:hypothetical protein